MPKFHHGSKSRRREPGTEDVGLRPPTFLSTFHSFPSTAKPQQVPVLKRTRERQSAYAKEQDKRLAGIEYEFPPASEIEKTFRHSHWKATRERVYTILGMSGASRTALQHFAECGSQATVEFSKSENRHRVRLNTCRSRHCEPCMRQRANRLAANLKAKLGQAAEGRFRFITLTLRHTSRPLIEQINRLVKSFRKLRHSKVWKGSQCGGCSIIEIKYNAKTDRWHPHLHIIADGDFIQQSTLSEAWHKATGDSHIVHIRILENERDAAHYLCKYVGKGTNSEVWQNPEAAIEFVIATKGVRVCGTFGTWRGYALMKSPEPGTDWVCVGTLDSIVRANKRGEAWAAAIWMNLRPPGSIPEVTLRLLQDY
jgi:hypothetical protein